MIWPINEIADKTMSPAITVNVMLHFLLIAYIRQRFDYDYLNAYLLNPTSRKKPIIFLFVCVDARSPETHIMCNQTRK